MHACNYPVATKVLLFLQANRGNHSMEVKKLRRKAYHQNKKNMKQPFHYYGKCMYLF